VIVGSGRVPVCGDVDDACNTGGMTVTTTRIERSGPAVRAALTDLSPDEAPRFEHDYRAALSRATDTLDLREADDVLNRWWGIACIRANPLSLEEEQLVRRIQAGDESALNSLSPGPDLRA
jgi:hypothetical protein